MHSLVAVCEQHDFRYFYENLIKLLNSSFYDSCKYPEFRASLKKLLSEVKIPWNDKPDSIVSSPAYFAISQAEIEASRVTNSETYSIKVVETYLYLLGVKSEGLSLEDVLNEVSKSSSISAHYLSVLFDVYDTEPYLVLSSAPEELIPFILTTIT